MGLQTSKPQFQAATGQGDLGEDGSGRGLRPRKKREGREVKRSGRQVPAEEGRRVARGSGRLSAPGGRCQVESSAGCLWRNRICLGQTRGADRTTPGQGLRPPSSTWGQRTRLFRAGKTGPAPRKELKGKHTKG